MISFTTPVTNRSKTYGLTHDELLDSVKDALYTSDGEELWVWRETAKPYLNAVDLVRIEQNTKIVADTLLAYGYGFPITTKLDWEMEDQPKSARLERIRSNIGSLISWFHDMGVPLPADLEWPHYTELNNLERILLLMYEMIPVMAESFRYSGTFYSGQTFNF